VSTAHKSIVMIDGREFTVWSGPSGVIAVTTDALHARMGFRHVPLTSKSAKAAIAKAQEGGAA